MSKYIDVDALMDELNNQFRDMDNNVYDSQDDALEDAEVSVRQIIYNMPVADVESVRHGEWIEDKYAYDHCSACGFEWDEAEYVSNFRDTVNYCPNCGAKMDGGDKND